MILSVFLCKFILQLSFWFFVTFIHPLKLYLNCVFIPIQNFQPNFSRLSHDATHASYWPITIAEIPFSDWVFSDFNV